MRTLFYDIETSLLMGHYFGLGKQVIRHSSLMGGYFDRTHIITLSYGWSDSDKVHTLDWGTGVDDEKKMVEHFDTQVEKADQVIGKNNRRFDDKLINTARLWFDLPGKPEWIRYNDDLESQMRKYFRLPSFTLDYISDQLGLGGKDSMQYSDWEDLSFYRMYQLAPESGDLLQVLTGKKVKEIIKLGRVALKKMSIYNQKDVKDTKDVWNFCLKHFEPKYNAGAAFGHITCATCGSDNIKRNGTRISGKSTFQQYYCNDHGGYAGRAVISKKGKIGKIG